MKPSTGRIKKQAEIRFAGWPFIHTIGIVVADDESYVKLCGIQIGPFSVYWTNPFAGD